MDNSEFKRIYNLFKSDIYYLAYSYTKNIADTDDIFQNVFVKLYKHKKILQNDDMSIKKWLVKVTINECKTLFLSTWKRKIIHFKDNEEENILEKRNYDNDLLIEIMKLKPKYRIVVYLYYYEDYKIKDISLLLKISESNIQTRLSRARLQLKEFLEED